MAEILIIVVIIIAVVVKIGMNSRLSSDKDTTQTIKNEPEIKRAKPNESGPEVSKAKPNEPKKKQKPFEKRSAVIKAKLVSGGNAAQNYAKNNETDILTAAKENTREVEIENDKDAVAAESLMESVYDLMAKGPEDTLEFQRDFVAEGMEMLNHIAIPDTWNAE